VTSFNPITIFIRCTVLVIISTLLFAYSAKTLAHEIKPTIIELKFASATPTLNNNVLSVEMIVNIESLIAGIGPDHKDTDTSENSSRYEQLRAMDDSELLSEFSSFKDQFISNINVRDSTGTPVPLSLNSITIPDTGDINIARDTLINLQSTMSKPTTALTWEWDSAFGEVIVRANSDVKDLDYAALLSAGQSSALIHFTQLSEQSKWKVISNYIVVGFEHILPKGLDHILFVIGVFLLIPAWRALAIQVTIFTIAHSITLALATNGLFTLPSSIVEPLIALSIVVICIENIYTDKLSKWRLLTIFIFGLIHGLGFASVLSAVGLDTQNFLIALFGFNIGVELGQLLIVSICMLGIGVWFGRHASYRNLFSRPASIVVGLIGLAWFLERILAIQ